jgi:hypothetical protein
LVTTLIAMTVQRRFSRKDAELEASRRRNEAELAELRALALAPRHLAVKRDETAKLELLKLFTDVQVEFNSLDLFHIPHSTGTAVTINGRNIRPYLRAAGPRLDDRLQAAAAPHLAQLTNDVERWLLSACIDITANWDQFDTFHGDMWRFQILVADACALYATQIIGASLRMELIPFPPRVLAVRLSDDMEPHAMRQRKPVDWDEAELALPKHYQFSSQALPWRTIAALPTGPLS